MLTRRFLFNSLLAGVAGTSLLPAYPGLAQLGNRPAPEFVGINTWLNSSGAVSIAGLRGKVVLVDFWTYSCINCRRTVPYLNRWQTDYGLHGLQVIGIHTPEFRFERQSRNVAQSVQEFGIRFPVGQDNGFETWRAWSNRAWPAFYLLDREGRIVLVREGEGHAQELEQAIRALLGLSPATVAARPGDDPDLSRIGSPELYFGSLHRTPQDPAQGARKGSATYEFPAHGPALDTYQLAGQWQREEEILALQSKEGALRLRFSAAKLHMVASAPEGVSLRIRVDRNALPPIRVGDPTLYTLFDSESYGEHLLELEVIGPGLSLFSTTFG